MKKLLIVSFVLFANYAKAQIEITAELNQALNGKIIFQEIKNTVLSHYTQKLSTLTRSDTVERKSMMRQLKMWNRKFWMEENYTNAQGIVQDKNKIDYEASKNLPISTNNSIATRQPIAWINHGPFNGNDGIGRIDKIAYHPTNADIMYAGSPHGGLFKSVDAGNTWFPLNGFLPSLGVSGIAIDYTNPNIIYVLTGDANSNLGCFNGQAGCATLGEVTSASQGVFKSYDGGVSWLQTGMLSTELYRGRELVMDPTNPNILFAATSSGLFRTNNAGATWTIPLVGGPNGLPPYLPFTGDVADVKFKPGDGNTVYCVYGSSFAKSTNSGATFSSTNVYGIGPGPDRVSIAVTPANPNRVILFAGPILSATTFRGIFTSNNSGQTFSKLTETPNLFQSTIGTPPSSSSTTFNNCVAISPTNENIICVGGVCVWKSTDGGTNWNQISAYRPSDNPYMHPDIHFLGYNPLNGSLYCGNDGGVYLYNGADNWIPRLQGLAITQFYHFERENDEGDVWGGSQDNGILEQNGGGNYYNYGTGDGYDVMSDHNYLVAGGGTNNDIYLSVNNFIQADPGPLDISVQDNICNTCANSFFANLGMSPTDEDRIYAGYMQGTYFSNNRGGDWTLAGGANPRPANWCLAVARSNGNVYTAGNNGTLAGLYKYPNENTAVNISPPAPYVNTLKITDIDIHPLDANIVYISVAGTTADAKVFVTTNGGTTWSNWSFNLPNVPIFCIKRDVNDGVYVGTSIGVYYKRNGLSYWEYFSNGLPPTPVTEIEMWPEPNPVNGNQPSNPPATPEIWISTFGRGIWYTQQYTSSCVNILPLTGNIQGTRFEEANNQVNSNQVITSTGTDVRYNAGQKITLSNGFRVLSNAKFKAKITPCGSPSE
jgi:hypothetical protein